MLPTQKRRMDERRHSSKPAVMLLVKLDLFPDRWSLPDRSSLPVGKNACCCQKRAGLATAATPKLVQC